MAAREDFKIFFKNSEIEITRIIIEGEKYIRSWRNLVEEYETKVKLHTR